MVIKIRNFLFKNFEWNSEPNIYNHFERSIPNFLNIILWSERGTSKNSIELHFLLKLIDLFAAAESLAKWKFDVAPTWSAVPISPDQGAHPGDLLQRKFTTTLWVFCCWWFFRLISEDECASEVQKGEENHKINGHFGAKNKNKKYYRT